MTSKTTTLIDLSSIFWQNWHAASDQEIGAAYDRTVQKVYSHVNGNEPVAICIDSPPYKRKEISPDYKAQRDKPSPLAVEQLRRVIEKLENDGFPVLGAAGYEADDVIATIAYKYKDISTPLRIVSSDKDILQLVNDYTTAKSPLTGDEFDVDEVHTKFGVYPVELGHWLALVGDKSDNVPGVPGIGAKTATRLISDIGWIELVGLAKIKDPGEILKPPGLRQKILDNYDQMMSSFELVKLMTNAPIDIDSIYKPRVPKSVKEERKIMEIDKPEEEQEEIDTGDPEQLPTPVTSIVKAGGNWALSLEPRDSTGAWKLSQLLYESRLYSKFPNPESILAVILRGRALGLDATTALDGFHVIQGRPTMSGQMIIGLVLQSGTCDYFKLLESTDTVATYKTHRTGDPDLEPVEVSFTIEKAQRMGLTGKDNWKKQPDTMLRWRAATELARIVYPDVVAGLYTPDEFGEAEYIEAEIVDK